MPLKSLVKVSHLSNLSDARYCAGMGVEILGFSAIPGAPHYLTPQMFQDIRGWVAGPRITAEIYGLNAREQIESVVRDYAPDYLEMSYEEYERLGDEPSLPCIVSVADVSTIKTKEMRSGIAYVIVEDETQCDDISSVPYPVLVKVSSVEKLKELLDKGCFKGFVLEGPEEMRPGYTNYDELGEILEALEDDA